MILNMEQMAKEVSDMAMDTIVYEGKTLREWIEIVKSRPPVVHAKWEPYDEARPGMYFSIRCSNCGGEVEKTYLMRESDFYDYCPFCGARMDGDPHDSGQ